MDKSNWERLNQKMMKNGWSEQAVFEIQDYLNEACSLPTIFHHFLI